ncbi:alpha/beta hydrolase [Belliella sp. R4-6]|uniref:Alpha/beta hydrolase n=1 Tax=Belliella alkalica TaxID=1730871 RepID=A0ABS9V8Z4_9BACT|nr:alpha/beta hydrolase [Belliella alkalica]MCH7412590.1 alpha/beta hydrolase [Belliella alkalica]
MKKFNLSCLTVLSAFLLIFSCSEKEEPILYPVDEDVILKDVRYGNHERNVMDVFLPSGRNPSVTKVLVLIHGGGWIGGDKSDFDEIINPENSSELKEQFPNVAIFNLNYRLATTEENRYPAAEEDIESAMSYIFAQANSFQVNGMETYLLGGSAGGHLAALYTVKNNSSRIKGCISIAGPYELGSLYSDGDNESRQVLNAFLGGSPQEKPEAYHEVSPINFISTNSPKFLLLHGRDDTLVPFSQAEKFQSALEGSNVEVLTVYYSGGHGIPPEHIEQAFDAIKVFLE